MWPFSTDGPDMSAWERLAGTQIDNLGFADNLPYAEVLWFLSHEQEPILHAESRQIWSKLARLRLACGISRSGDDQFCSKPEL